MSTLSSPAATSSVLGVSSPASRTHDFFSAQFQPMKALQTGVPPPIPASPLSSLLHCWQLVEASKDGKIYTEHTDLGLGDAKADHTLAHLSFAASSSSSFVASIPAAAAHLAHSLPSVECHEEARQQKLFTSRMTPEQVQKNHEAAAQKAAAKKEKQALASRYMVRFTTAFPVPAPLTSHKHRSQVKQGPLALLRTLFSQRQRITVVTRRWKGVRSVLLGMLIAYDKHMNLILMDVDEEYIMWEWHKGPKGEDGRDTFIRVPVTKKRHARQLYVRGDNIVLVAEKGPSKAYECVGFT